MCGLLSGSNCNQLHKMFRNHRQCWADVFMEHNMDMTKARRSSPAHVSSSRRRGLSWRSWLLLSIAAVAMLSSSITQVQANRSNSFSRSTRFHRAGLVNYSKLPRSLGKQPSEKYSQQTSSSSISSRSSLPSPKSWADLRAQSASSQSPRRSPTPRSTKTRTEPDALARLSKVFGMSRIPHHAIHRSPPQYMQEVYASTTDTGGLTRARGPYNSNTIRSFPDKDSVHRMHFHYNVSYLEEAEKILQAEFRIFKMKPGLSRKGEQRPPHVMLIKVYQVLDITDMNEPKNLRLLGARRVSAHAHGWNVFNVTSAVLDWYNRKANNFGLLVTAETVRGRHVNGSFLRFAQRNEHHDSKQPVLVIFAEDEGRKHANYISPEDEGYRQMKEDLLKHERQKKQRKNNGFKDAVRMLNEKERRRSRRHSRSTRSVKSSRNNKDRRRSKSARTKRNSKNRARGGGRGGGRKKRTYDVYRRYRHKNRSCSRYEMFVDFEEIGWSGWIISPNSYSAFRCDGGCPFPLGQSQKPTNHATVQSIVHAIAAGKNVGTPCCVPNKLYSISLLYFDDNENVILKQYDDMVVASCGCH